MSRPLIAPRATPTKQEIKNAKNILSTPLAIRTLAAIYCPEIAIAVKDISIPPESKTIKTPIAIIPITALLLPRSNRFSRDKKEEFR
jgi:hypothetical protein